ncbi:MAG: lysylphosphatidylglycerol synthase domain-containing protein [Geminicoccaceae bacterium]
MSRRKIVALVLAGILLPLFAWFLWRQWQEIDLREVVASARAIPLLDLMAALGFAALSYLCLTGFDFLAVRYAGKPLPYHQVAPASFVSLSIGHNIGIAALSSGAIRYRFYSRLGLSEGDVGRVILFCGVTVGVGLLALAGLAAVLNPSLAGEILRLDSPLLVIGLGLACLVLVAGYVAMAAFVRRAVHIRRWRIEMPPLRLALGQVALGPLNFACVAGCLYWCVAALGDVGYPGVATAYVIGNLAALVSHVPGGLGVLEGVVMVLLPGASVAGGLLVFRAVYFLLPLAIGAPLFGLIELWGLGRRQAVTAPA